MNARICARCTRRWCAWLPRCWCSACWRCPACQCCARSEERRVGKECRSLCDWSSDVCSSDLDEREDLRTLHATLVCVASALLVFGVLALSSVPVLRAIGLTVALGVLFHFALSVLMAPHAAFPLPSGEDARPLAPMDRPINARSRRSSKGPGG